MISIMDEKNEQLCHLYLCHLETTSINGVNKEKKNNKSCN